MAAQPALGAAVPAVAGPLAMPAPPTVTFANFFSDATNDPLNGHYRELFAHFDIDLNQANTSTTPAALRDLIAAAGAQHQPLALAILREGLARVLLCPQRMERSLGAPASPLDDRTFAFDGDLFRNQGLNVEVSPDVYNLVPNATLVPTVPHILAQLAANPALTSLGPYANGDANTEVIRVRRVVPIPFTFVSLFLAQPVTPRFFFESIHPVMVASGIEADCASFIRFFQVAITSQNNAAPESVLNVDQPIAPPRSTRLLASRDALIQHYFPQLNAGLAALQQNQIALQLANFTQQTHQHRLDDEARRAAEKFETVEKFLGEDKRDKLLRMSLVAHENQLAPFWNRIANVKKSERLGVLQSYLDAARETLGEDHLTFVADSALLSATTSLMWPLLSKDAIDSGCGGNAFRFCDSDLELAHHLNSKVELVLSGSAAPSLSDAAEPSSSIVLHADGSNRYAPMARFGVPLRQPPVHSLSRQALRDCVTFLGSDLGFLAKDVLRPGASGLRVPMPCLWPKSILILSD